MRLIIVHENQIQKFIYQWVACMLPSICVPLSVVKLHSFYFVARIRFVSIFQHSIREKFPWSCGDSSVVFFVFLGPGADVYGSRKDI